MLEQNKAFFFNSSLFMSRSDGRRTHDIPLRRLPSIRGGVTLICIEDSALSSPTKSDEMIARLRALKNYYILRYTKVSKCIKYLKRARSYESVIVLIVMSGEHTDRKETSIAATDVSRLYHYHQVQTIIIISPTIKQIDSDTENDLLTVVRKDTDKVIGIFRDHQSAYVRLQQLISETEEFDDGLFSTFNRREKALRDVRHELGAFVWSHSYRGQCSSLIKYIYIYIYIQSFFEQNELVSLYLFLFFYSYSDSDASRFIPS